MSSLQIIYGTKTCGINVTEICMNQLRNNNIITIPYGEVTRAYYFSDPIIGTEKKVFIIINNAVAGFDANYMIHINIDTNEYTFESDVDVGHRWIQMKSKLQFQHGKFEDEIPEMLMALRFLKGDEKILEIGGNIGRNSLIISHIMGKNQENLVVMESDEETASQLIDNRNINNRIFQVENSALSKRKLIQKGWMTHVTESDVLPEGHKWVKTISLPELRAKYNIKFDTLVLDCETAFYYILKDYPEILDGINLIIMENDYHTIEPKKYVDEVLTKHGFYRYYIESGGWGPCFGCFYETWKRRT